MPERFNAFSAAILRASRLEHGAAGLGLASRCCSFLCSSSANLAPRSGFREMADGEVMLAVLKLVDLALIANLVVMIIGAGVDMLRRVSAAGDDTTANGLDIIDFGVIKLKLFASISAIAAIYLLERVHQPRPDRQDRRALGNPDPADLCRSRASCSPGWTD